MGYIEDLADFWRNRLGPSPSPAEVLECAYEFYHGHHFPPPGWVEVRIEKLVQGVEVPYELQRARECLCGT